MCRSGAYSLCITHRFLAGPTRSLTCQERSTHGRDDYGLALSFRVRSLRLGMKDKAWARLTAGASGTTPGGHSSMLFLDRLSRLKLRGSGQTSGNEMSMAHRFPVKTQSFREAIELWLGFMNKGSMVWVWGHGAGMPTSWGVAGLPSPALLPLWALRRSERLNVR
jgi:hypothetical protein